MIIYGVKNAKLASETISDRCSECDKPGTTEVSIFQKYAHIFWIPLFPLGKTGVSHCAHCKATKNEKEMSPAARQAFDNLKQQNRPPLWTFSGIAVLALLIALGAWVSKQNHAQNATLIAAPQAGDVYDVKLAPGSYTVFKVASVAGDSVYLLESNYESDKIKGLKSLREKGADGFSEMKQPLTKQELQSRFDNGEIIDVERK